MADLAELSGSGRNDVFPGLRLAPPDLLDVGECEKEFEAKHLAYARAAANGQHPDAAEKIMGRAVERIGSGYYSWGSPHFDDEALKAQYLPLWIYLELRHHHPDITREKAGELLRNHPDPARVQDVVMGLAGYSFVKKNPTTGSGPAAPQTGIQSSALSESSESVTATSEPSPPGNSHTPSESAGEPTPAPPAG